ncbi:MAG: type II toxin-antitoxin system VapC family toxin [Thiohalocapsa sp.]|uniref:type II toxin-antitoxin system VapC family toxin n=1 Tax=Thiohalocapsa sp. TaxID=2497641 RepID=UPI0025ECF67C|nr:type II toxin-antitoxin system VapC family toxin [Thiohalocapsa sp.]MCG6940777.1 type II toxin-antitoxin system VapC family toxin [Thiohalocapsa sp.]
MSITTVHDYFADHLPANDFRLIKIGLEHAALVESLPLHHRDPFDRPLAAQARHEELMLISGDAAFDDYGITRVWQPS